MCQRIWLTTCKPENECAQQRHPRQSRACSHATVLREVTPVFASLYERPFEAPPQLPLHPPLARPSFSRAERTPPPVACSALGAGPPHRSLRFEAATPGSQWASCTCSIHICRRSRFICDQNIFSLTHMLSFSLIEACKFHMCASRSRRLAQVRCVAGGFDGSPGAVPRRGLRRPRPLGRPVGIYSRGLLPRP